MTKLSLLRILQLLVFGCAFVAGTSNAGTLYRFVDKNGRIVVDSALPPAVAQRGYDVLDDKNLRLIERVPPKRSDAQIEADQRSQLNAEEIRRKKREQRRRDRNLLATYLTLEDVKLAKVGRLHSIKNSIGFTESAISSLKQKLSSHIFEASVHELDGNAVPKALIAEIDQTREEIARNQRLVETYRQQLQSVEQQFDEDIKRFAELKKNAATR